jgi:hypothetical protein
MTSTNDTTTAKTREQQVVERDDYLVALAQHLDTTWDRYEQTLTALDEAWTEVQTCPAADLSDALFALANAQTHAWQAGVDVYNLPNHREQLHALRCGYEFDRFDQWRDSEVTWPGYVEFTPMAALLAERCDIDLGVLRARCERFVENDDDAKEAPRNWVHNLVRQQQRTLAQTLAARVDVTAGHDGDEPGAALVALVDAIRAELSTVRAERDVATEAAASYRADYEMAVAQWHNADALLVEARQDLATEQEHPECATVADLEAQKDLTKFASADAKALRTQRNIIAVTAAVIIVVLVIASIPTWA